jgi:hypothetical protein
MSAPEKKPVARPGEPIDGQDAHYLAFVQAQREARQQGRSPIDAATLWFFRAALTQLGVPAPGVPGVPSQGTPSHPLEDVRLDLLQTHYKFPRNPSWEAAGTP